MADIAVSDVQFQSAPLTGARGDDLSAIPGARRCLAVSIRSPDRSQGRRDTLDLICWHYYVSIRSPDRSQGRLIASTVGPVYCKFQSAPLTGARGDRSSHDVAAAAALFQSAPLTGARGDAGCCNQRNSRQLPK